MDLLDVTRITSSTTISVDPAILGGLLVATDGVNSPTITAYNDVDANTEANRVTPPMVVSASSQEYVGFFPGQAAIRCRSALHIAISDLGTGEVMVYWRTM